MHGWAARLGSSALALERFSRMYQQVQQERRASVQHEGAAGQAGPCDEGSGSDDAPGGITSKTTLAPRLAVEQAEVKRIGSDAGQFGDFSRKPAARQTGVGALPTPPRGVLKKASCFAAGNQSVPIMLSEVKASCVCSTMSLRALPMSAVLCWGCLGKAP